MAVTTREQRLRDVREWIDATVAGPSLGQRAEKAYTFVLVCAIFGSGLFDAVHSALAQVMSADGTATWGPGVVLVGVVVTARWGAYQGPVVFAVADVAHLLGAPLSRRGLAARRLAISLAEGAAAGALVGGTAVVGLAGHSHGFSAARGAGLVVALAAVGVIGVACAWGVQASARAERVLGPLTWLALAAAIALGLLGRHDDAVVRIERWSGPWGWATAPVRGGQWELAVVLIVVTAAIAAAAALRGCGTCPAERHLRRAEARAGAAASLVAFDTRSMRQALQTASEGKKSRGSANLRWVRHRSLPGQLAWRSASALRRTPARVAEALVLGAGATTLLLVTPDRVTAALVGGLLLYLAATRVLEPLREEIDKPGRARILLRASWGHILLAHVTLPLVLVVLSVALGVGGCAAAGGILHPGGALVVAALAGAAPATLAAALSARRGGRLPMSVLSMASSDASGASGFMVVGYLLMWPLIGALSAGLPAALVAHSGVRGLQPALMIAVLSTTILGVILRASKDT